jgi:hypothetical protein
MKVGPTIRTYSVKECYAETFELEFAKKHRDNTRGFEADQKH